MSVLFPEGISNIGDLPHHLHEAISKGLAFVSFDELPSDERPPKSIWLDQERLSKWFDKVAKRREDKYGGGDKKPIEDPVENEAASALVSGL